MNFLKVHLPKDPQKIINSTLVIFSFYSTNKIYPFYWLTHTKKHLFSIKTLKTIRIQEWSFKKSFLLKIFVGIFVNWICMELPKLYLSNTSHTGFPYLQWWLFCSCQRPKFRKMYWRLPFVVWFRNWTLCMRCSALVKPMKFMKIWYLNSIDWSASVFVIERE